MKRECAYTVFEYVLIVPLLCLLVLGAFDLCSIWNAYAGLQQGVATGLRCLTTPDSNCHLKNERDYYSFEYRKLGFEYRHPVYQYSAEEQWLEGPTRILSDFRATVLDTVSLLEPGHQYQIIRPHYDADFVHWEELQRAPSISFPEGHSGVGFRKPRFTSIATAKEEQATQVELGSTQGVHIMRLTSHEGLDGIVDAPCLRKWQGVYEIGGCDPRQVRVVLHVKGHARGRGKVRLSIARVSSDRVHLRKDAKQWRSLGGQRYSAGSANFFPRGIPLTRNDHGRYIFLEGLSEEELPQEFTSNYNRLLSLREGQALWIKVEWEEGHPWMLEGVAFYKSQYRYQKTKAPVEVSQGIVAVDPAHTPVVHGIRPLLDPDSVRQAGEQLVSTACAYDAKTLTQECLERYGTCRVVEKGPHSCIPIAGAKRIQRSCVENYGVRPEERNLQALLNVCLPSEQREQTSLDRKPIFSKRHKVIPETIELVKASCSDATFLSDRVLPDRLRAYKSLQWKESRGRTIHVTRAVPPKRFQREQGMRCEEFVQQSRTLAPIALSNEGYQIETIHKTTSMCDWRSELLQASAMVRSVEGSHIQLSRQRSSYEWRKEPPAACSGEEERKRLRPRGDWELVPGGPFLSSKAPNFCMQDDVQCRIRKQVRGELPQVNEKLAMQLATNAAMHHSPIVSKQCTTQRCFTVKKGANGHYAMQGSIELPLKSLFLLQRILGRDSILLSHQEEDQHERYVLF